MAVASRSASDVEREEWVAHVISAVVPRQLIDLRAQDFTGSILFFLILVVMSAVFIGVVVVPQTHIIRGMFLNLYNFNTVERTRSCNELDNSLLKSR